MSGTRSHDPVTTPGKPAQACPRPEPSQDPAPQEIYRPKKIRSDVNPDPPTLSVLRPPAENGHSPSRSPRNGRPQTVSNVGRVEVEPTSKPTKPSEREGHVTETTCKLRLEDLEKTAKAIRDHHKKACGAYRTSLEHAIHAGKLLLEAKRHLEHGRFSPWVNKMCKVSPRSAREYMQIAKAVEEGLIDLDDPKRRPAAGLGGKEIHRQLAKPRAKHPETDTDSETTTTTNATDPGSADPSKADGEQQRPDRRDRDDHHDRDERTSAEAGAATTTQDNSSAAAEATGQGEAATALNPTDGPDDEAWLKTLPIRSLLANPTVFDQQARLWRLIQPAMDLLLELHTPSDDDLKHAVASPFYRRHYSSVVAAVAAFGSPDKWALCAKCRGLGKKSIRGGECDYCHRTGFRYTHERHRRRRKNVNRQGT